MTNPCLIRRTEAAGLCARTAASVQPLTAAPSPLGGSGALTPGTYYAVDTDPGLVDAIDARTGRITRTYDAGAEPNALAVDRTTLWVVDEATGRLLRFDLGRA